MKDLTKKIMILAMVGMVQVGVSAAVSGMVQVGVNTAIAKASPLQKFDQHKIVHFDDRHDDQQRPIVPQPEPQPQPQPHPQPQPEPEPQPQ